MLYLEDYLESECFLNDIVFENGFSILESVCLKHFLYFLFSDRKSTDGNERKTD